VAYLNDEIRGILTAAQLEQGMSAAEAARAAQAGELENLPPTKVSETICRELAAQARRASEPKAEAESPAPVDWVATRAEAILEREMARLDEAAERGKLKPQDVSHLKRLLQVAREIKAMQLGFIVPGNRTRRLADEPQQENGNGDSESAILAAIEQSESDNG
jgi:uncharacterized membrane protein YccC